MKVKKSYEMNMSEGNLLKQILIFSAPLALTSVLQLLYNAADVIVVGKFAGKEALAAVGSTGPLINLLINIFIGLSIGSSVAVSKAYGARDSKTMFETVHTSIAIGLLGGILLAVVGFFTAKPLLSLMGTPADVLDLSSVYVQIFFIGMPANLLYNFGAAILRAVGDTKRPLYFLTISGIANVLLNLLFVVVFKMSVVGVALATIISQIISAVFVMGALINANNDLKVYPRRLKIFKQSLIDIARVGIPAGVQGSLFSISNVLIQSSVNSFGSVVMAGCAAAGNIDGFIYVAMNAICQADLAFASQNIGAKQYKRVRKVLWVCLLVVTVVGLTTGGITIIFGRSLLGLYSSDVNVINVGLERMLYICLPYFLCGCMEVLVGQLRSLGYSFLPMMVSLTGACIFRVIWIFTIFKASPTIPTLFISYPISWGMTAAIHLICYLILVRKLPRKDEQLATTT